MQVMKRYRVLIWDFDIRVRTLADPIENEWEEWVKKQCLENRSRIEQGLLAQYGEERSEEKKKNFIDLGVKPFSIVAFHNQFFEQVRTSFIMEAYYPALVGVCTLGERILNHLILILRDYYRSTPEYKKVWSKESFDDWSLAIDTLWSWDVILPGVKDGFIELMKMRHKAIHFRPETDQNARELALSAIKCLQKIIGEQFSGVGPQPWFITDIPGEIYIKLKWENNPFIMKVYLSSCVKVGPNNIIKSLCPLNVNDQFEYEETVVSDDEFVRLRKKAQNRNQ